MTDQEFLKQVKTWKRVFAFFTFSWAAFHVPMFVASVFLPKGLDVAAGLVCTFFLIHWYLKFTNGKN